MNPVLVALGEAYQRSAAGRSGGVRDFTIDYEKLLRGAGLADGEARVQAEQDLALAEARSAGGISIDRQPRSGHKLRVRVSAGRGEPWLFEALGLSSPSTAREELSQFFQAAGSSMVPESLQSGWSRMCQRLSACAASGESVHPFARDDDDANRRLLSALVGVLNWSHESLIRYASVRLLGDSKSLEALRPRIEAGLREITGKDDSSLEDFRVLQVPRSVVLHGPLLLRRDGRDIDFGRLSAPVSISAQDLDRFEIVVAAPLCLTVENESVFQELARNNPGVLLVQTSFPSSGTLQLLKALPVSLPCFHFGDTDPAGFDILRDLRERTGRHVAPLLMEIEGEGPDLTPQDHVTIERLLDCPTLSDVHDRLREMQVSGKRGAFEQERFNVECVVEALSGPASLASIARDGQ